MPPRAVLLSLALLGSARLALAGEPVVLPDFTPTTTAEAVLSVMLYDEARRALEGAGFRVIGPAEAEGTVKPGSMDSCATAPTCPTVALALLPARIALVVRIETRGDGAVGIVESWVEDQAEPSDVWEIPVHAGDEYAFGVALVGVVNNQSGRLGPVPDELKADGEALIAAGDPSGQERYLAGSRAAFEASGLSVDEWIDEAVPHAGRLVLEVRGGVGVGDVGRAADVHVDLDASLSNAQDWFQESPSAGAGVQLALAAGYAPLTWLEITLGLGVQTGHRRVGTTWSIDGVLQDQGAAKGSATQLLIEPRGRFILPTGTVKPYALAGTQIRMFDQYQIDSSDVGYPEPPGGTFVAPVIGAGWMVDPSPLLGVFLEGTFAYHLGLRSAAAELGGAPPADRPPIDTFRGYTVGVAAGAQVRLP